MSGVVASPPGPVRVRVSEDARSFIERRGGRLFVWAGRACCGGTRFVESSPEPPHRAEGFLRIPTPGFELYVRPSGGRLPDELDIELPGRRHTRVRAAWNGCVYLI